MIGYHQNGQIFVPRKICSNNVNRMKIPFHQQKCISTKKRINQAMMFGFQHRTFLEDEHKDKKKQELSRKNDFTQRIF